MSVHTHPIRVYYEDTDLAGVVYYANYLKFFERGRTEALRALGVDQGAMKAAGLVFVVTRVEIDYRRPARFDDFLSVETEVHETRRASVRMRQRVTRDGAVCAEGAVRCAVMREDGRAARLPDAVRAALGG